MLVSFDGLTARLRNKKESTVLKLIGLDFSLIKTAHTDMIKQIDTDKIDSTECRLDL